jgi:3-oxoacyl-[acyl-carrier protein] reductase
MQPEQSVPAHTSVAAYCRIPAEAVFRTASDIVGAWLRRVAADGAQILRLSADATRLSDLERVVKATVDSFDVADIVFNNSGGPKPGVFADLSDQDWRSAVGLNLMSAVMETRLCLPLPQRLRCSSSCIPS